jgi:hypothetical protein
MSGLVRDCISKARPISNTCDARLRAISAKARFVPLTPAALAKAFECSSVVNGLPPSVCRVTFDYYSPSSWQATCPELQGGMRQPAVCDHYDQ